MLHSLEKTRYDVLLLLLLLLLTPTQMKFKQQQQKNSSGMKVGSTKEREIAF